jgi:hypothetical protein
MDEFTEGYRDGRIINSPEPSENRSEEYKDSFDFGRRELRGKVLSAQGYRERAAKSSEIDANK